jgi:hypothetical protein
MYADIVFTVGTAMTPTTGANCLLYCAPAPDGTNYGDNKRENTCQLIASFSLDTANSAKRVVVKNVMLPPCHIKFYMDNQAGANLPGTGNTVVIYPYGPEVQ